MPHSMTGYGRANLAKDGRELTIELKSVNHRFLDISFRMPRFFSFLEDEMRKAIGEELSRGHIDIYVTYRNIREDSRIVKVDQGLLNAYLKSFSLVRSTTGLENDLTLMSITQMPDVLAIIENDEDQQELKFMVNEVLMVALKMLKDMRRLEGDSLKNDVLARLMLLEENMINVNQRMPQVLIEYREKLRTRISELLQSSMDEMRLSQEVAIMADRCAVDEEMVRLTSHISQVRLCFQRNDAIGRKLDFIVQEMNREINTTGSKSSDITLTNIVVDMKTELEKIREQVQNIE